MIAKCRICNLVHVRGMRKTCPHCRSPLTRPSLEELQELGEKAMDRLRAARAYIEARPNDPHLRLAAFMAIFHGRNMNRFQVEQMMKG